ncbi:MAG: PAS domain S-box protein [Methylobacter sp.]
MLIEVAVPVEGVSDHSLEQGESNPSELSVIDPRIAGSASDASIFTANRPSSPFAVVVFQKRIDQVFLQAVERKTGMWPLIFSPDGQHSRQLGPLNLSLQELLPDLAQASAGIKAKTVSSGQGSFYAAALPWQFEQQPGFVLALVASQDSTLQNIRQTVAAILTVTGLILAFSIGVGIFWVGRIIDPIIALTNAVKAIGLVSRLERGRQSDYRLTTENLRPLAISAPGEIGDLAWAFDMMIAELQHSFDSLEQRVQDRTVKLLALQQVLEKQNQRLEKQSSDLSEGNRLLQEEIGERKSAEDLLRQREQEFRSLAENSPDNIARYDRECRIKYMNSQLHATLGLFGEAHIGKTTTELYPDGRFDAYEDVIKSVIETGLAAEYEVVLSDTGDGVRYHLVRMVTERDQHGKVMGVLALGRDITERRQMESALLRSRRVLTEAQRIAHIGSWELDLVDNVLVWSDEIFRIFEIDREQFSPSYAAFLDAVHPDDRETVNRAYTESLKLREPYEIEHRLLMADGRIKYVLERCETRYADDGNPLYSLGTVQDITESKHVQHQMGLLNRAINQSSDSIFLVDEQLRFTYVNDRACRSLGYSRDELLAMQVPDIDPYVDMMAGRHITEQTRSQGFVRFETFHRTKDGHVFPVEISGTEIEHEGEMINLAVARDISERKRMEAELKSQADFQQTILNAVADAGMQVMMLEEGRIIHVGNRKLAYEFGFTDEDIDAYPVLTDIIHLDDRERILDYHTRRVAGEALPASYELGLVTRGGERREYETSVAIVPNTHPVRVITVGKDITERKRMETELLRQADFQQTLLNAIRDVGMQMLVIENGRMVYIGNRASAHKFGFIDEEIAAHPSFIDFVHPDDRERVIGYHVSREKGEAVPSSYELGLVNRNGERREFETSVAVVPGTDPVRTIAICKDITERKRMEQALASREQELRALAESSPGMVGSFYSRPDGSICMPYASPNIWELFGLRPEDVADDASPLLALNHPADAERVAASIAESARTMTTWHLEYRVLHPTRGERWMEGNSNPQPHQDGGIIWYGFVHDITERKQAEAEKQHLINILEQSAVFIGSADMQSRLLYHNRAARRMVGLPEDADLSAMIMADMHPEWALKMIKEQGIPTLLKDGVWHGETAVRHHDGSEIPVSQLLVLHRDVDGKPLFHSTIMRDITERKQAENEIRALNADLELRVQERTEELRRQTSYLRTMIDTLPMMAWFKDTDSRFLVVNQVFALAAARTPNVDDMVGKCDFDFWPREHAEVYRADDAEVMATRQRKAVEEPFVDAHDGAIWIETFKAPVMDEDGRVLGTVGLARDISERKAVEVARDAALAEAERLARLRSEFMARMSHELRTPLNGILGYAQIMLGENQLNERYSVMLGVIQQSGEYLLCLINDILDFAKIEAGKQELSLGDISLAGFLSNLTSIINVKAEQKYLAFLCDIAADVPRGIRVDETRLRQVLLNLLSNAVKYSEQGQIRLRVTVLKSDTVDLSNTKPSPEGEGAKVPAATILEPVRLRFEVKDSGIGIDAGQLETIFQPFEQAGDSHHHNGGSGLGLVISRELVRLMGSDIHVSSRVGVGSTFWFDLDAPVVAVYGNIMPAEQRVSGYQGPRRRVLVVDDVYENRALLVDILSRLGFETSEAANGRACLDSAAALRPDLILLDMVMPEMDGMETAQRLRRLPGVGKTPIIAISASASGSDIGEVMKSGVSLFLSKPVDIKQLMVHIAGLLKLDWIYALPEAESPPQHRFNEWLEVPPLEEMKVLHRLAQEGSMRDIIGQAAYLGDLDERYRPFAEQLRMLARGYQSKAILDLINRYINRYIREQKHHE